MAKIWFERPSEEVISRRNESCQTGFAFGHTPITFAVEKLTRMPSIFGRQTSLAISKFYNLSTRTQAEWNVNEHNLELRVAQSAQSIAQQSPVICLSLWILYWRKP